MRLWIGLYLLQLPLDVFSSNWSTDLGACSRGNGCWSLRSTRAARIGMGLGDVLTLMREERVVERSSEREAEALNAVAMGLMQYTP